MRLVCPTCKDDDRLYSLEMAEIMYPIAASSPTPEDGSPIEYTGDDRIVIDEGTVFEGRIYCRGCDTEMRHGELLMNTRCDGCGTELVRKQGDPALPWRDLDDVADNCDGTTPQHFPVAS